MTVSSTQGISRAITEVVALLEAHKAATITAINLAIPSAVNLVELIKHRVKGIYQQNSFEKVADSNKTRAVFKLSLIPLDSTHSGYQAPIHESEVTEKTFEEMRTPPPPPAYAARRTENLGETEIGGQGESQFRGRRGGRRTRRSSRAGRGERGERSERGGRSERTYEVREGEEGQRRGGRGGARRGRRPRGERTGRSEPGMEKYQLVRNREETKRQDNEIYVSTRINPILSVKDGLLLFKKKGLNSIVIKGSGGAVAKALQVAEEIRAGEPGLHQQTTNEKRVVKDIYRPIEEGLSEVVKERNIDGVQIVLSRSAGDVKHTGYLPPLAADKVRNLTVEQVEKL